MPLTTISITDSFIQLIRKEKYLISSLPSLHSIMFCQARYILSMLTDDLAGIKDGIILCLPTRSTLARDILTTQTRWHNIQNLGVNMCFVTCVSKSKSYPQTQQRKLKRKENLKILQTLQILPEAYIDFQQHTISHLRNCKIASGHSSCSDIPAPEGLEPKPCLHQLD